MRGEKAQYIGLCGSERSPFMHKVSKCVIETRLDLDIPKQLQEPQWIGPFRKHVRREHVGSGGEKQWLPATLGQDEALLQAHHYWLQIDIMMLTNRARIEAGGATDDPVRFLMKKLKHEFLYS